MESGVFGESGQFRVLTPRNVLVFLATLALVFGTWFRIAELLALGTMLLTAIGWAWWRAWTLLRDVRIERLHHPRVFEDQQLPVELVLSNDRGARANLLLVEDIVPASSVYRLRTLIPDTIEGGMRIVVRYTAPIDKRRGLYLLGPVRVTGSDPFGLFQREFYHENMTSLVVYPGTVELRDADLLGEGTKKHSGMETRPRRGTGEEIIGIREYRPGDPVQHVHWRSFARRNIPMVKEFQQQLTTRVTIFLDLGRQGLAGLGEQTSIEYSIKAAASIARRTADLSHESELFAIGQKVEHVPPGMGIPHLLTILDRLSIMKPDQDSAFPVVVRDLLPLLPPGATAVLILSVSTILPEQHLTLVDQMEMLQLRPILVMVDDRGFIKLFAHHDHTHGKDAHKLEDLARELTLHGGTVRVIRKAKSIQQALLQGLERDYVLD